MTQPAPLASTPTLEASMILRMKAEIVYNSPMIDYDCEKQFK